MSTGTKIIIYDDACPLCAAYTNAFVQTGLIDASGRKDFSSIDPELLSIVDVNRCKHEIPVIDSNTKQVWYGIDGLLEILGQRQQWIRKIGHTRPVKWMLYRLYRLISYNRRVIVARTMPAGNFDCTPELNIKYRFIFMFLFLCFNTLMLMPVWKQVVQNSFFSSASPQRLQSAHFILVAVNLLLFFRLPRKIAWEYLGQVNMLALVTILLLVPLMLLNRFGGGGYDLTNFYLGALCLFVIYEYRRRMAFAGVLRRYKGIVMINMIAIGLFLFYLTR